MKKSAQLKNRTSLAVRLSVFISAAVLAAAFTIPTAFMQERSGQVQNAERLNPKVNSAPAKKELVDDASAKSEAPAPQTPEVASNYAFTTAANASLSDMSSGTTQLVAANLDDTASAVTNIGFDFYFQGARFTQFSANSNGLMRLGGTAVQGGSPYKPLAQAGLSLITPYGADLRTHTTGKVHFKVTGMAPNRVLIVEWLNMQANFNSGGTVDLSYQARLYENTGVIEFVYASMTMSAAGAADVNSRDPNIGFSSSNTVGTVGSVTAPQTGTPAPTFDGSSATAVANLYTAGSITVLSSAMDGSRRIFTFTPPVPLAPGSMGISPITANSLTLNWSDNSSNEVGFAIYRSTDNVNFSFVTLTAANATSFMDTGLFPGTQYFYRINAVTEGALSTDLAMMATTSAPGNITSAASGNWSAPATWVGGVVPTSTDNATIANGHTVTIDSSNAFSVTVQNGGILQFEQTTARTLTVASSVTIDSGGTFQSNPAGTVTTHVLSVGTNLINNGTLDFSTNANTAGAGITFTGAANNTFSGTGATTNVRTITINKGVSNANILELMTSNFSVQGVTTNVAGFLTLTNGTFKISGTFTMANRIFPAATYVIPATGGIWLNNPNFTVSAQAGGTTCSNSGLFRMTDGIYNIGVTGADGMGGGTGAVFIVEGGTINAVRIDPQNAVSWTQTAGTMNLGIVSNTRSNFGTFELFSGTSSFTMSGGTVNLIQATVAATPVDYRVLSNPVNFSGGTLNVGTGATATNFNFRISGNTPNLVIDNTTNNKTVTFIATTTNRGTVLVNTGTTYNLNGFLVATAGATFTNNGTVTGTTANSRMYWLGAGVAQTYMGSGTVTPVLVSFDVDNAMGVTIDPGVSSIVTRRIILFTGGITNTNKLTLGNADATVNVVQIGNTTTPTAAGTFDMAPTFNLGTGGQTINYLRTTTSRMTGNEVNPTRTLVAMSYDDNDPMHTLTIAGGDLTLSNAATALTLTNGHIVTGANNLILSSGTATVTRTNGFVEGNFRKTYAATGSKSFEVGTPNGFSPVTVNATAGTFPSTLTVAATQGAHPAVNPATSVQRYWTLTEGGDITATLTFQYLVADVMGTEANYKVIRSIGGTSVAFPLSTVNTGAHNAMLAGVTEFSDWTVGEIASPTAAPASISGQVTTTSGAPLAGVTMRLGGARSALAITDANGNYRFANIDTDNFYTVTPAIVNYHFSPASRSFSLLANVTDAVFTGSLDSVITGNVIDTPEYFVRQHYLDFLGREPDSAGLNFWSNQIIGCGNDFNCIERRTINVSAAYFLSIEFQETGGLVDGLYRASYVRAPLYAEFMPDTARVARDVVVGNAGWEQQLATNKQEFLDAWVDRAAFHAVYDNLTNDGYVDALINNTRVTFTEGERVTLVNGLNEGTLSRAAVLQRVAQDERFARAKFNEAFVRMQYFGYLRRDPDDSGFHFWLNKLNEFDGNFERAEMVKAFLVSGEYRNRFAQ